MRKSGNWRQTLGLTALIIFMNPWQAATAREVWNCTYEGNGDNPAHYITRFEKRASDLIEPHWPRSVSYRILANSRTMLVAVHAYAEPPSFRRDARMGATVLIIDKRTGRLHRSTTAIGDSADQVVEGSCETR